MSATAARLPAAPLSRSRRLRGIVIDIALRYGLVVTAVLVWEVLAGRAASIYFPPPSDIAVAMWQLWFSGSPPMIFTDGVLQDVLPSLGRMFQGWLVAAVMGIVLGVVIGRSTLASDLSMPIVNFLRSTPGPALIPVFLILLGTGDAMRVSLIAFSSIWPILLNTIDGVQTVDRVQLDTARVFGLPRSAVLRHVILPAASPKILAGLRVAVAVALVLMVISELVAATSGLGHQLVEAQRFFRLTDMWAAIVLLAGIGYVLNLAFLRLERRMLAWHHDQRRR